MFAAKDINEFVFGNLSDDGYENMIRDIGFLVKKRNWKKIIIVSEEELYADYWTTDEIRELAHQFFTWAYSNKIPDSFEKIPQDDWTKYFTRIFNSFVADRISEEQQKKGLSYEKSRELVGTICKENYYSKTIKGKTYVFSNPFEEKDINVKREFDIDSFLRNLSYCSISEGTKHYKPLVVGALDNIFILLDCPVDISKVVKIIFILFDQSVYFDYPEDITYPEEFNPDKSKQHQNVIQKLLVGLSKKDAQIISEYLFQSDGNVSLSDLAKKFDMPKSTIHKKIESFKKKLVGHYFPENEEDTKIFLQNISSKVDELTK